MRNNKNMLYEFSTHIFLHYNLLYVLRCTIFSQLEKYNEKMTNYFKIYAQKKQPLTTAVQHTRENVRPTEANPIPLSDSQTRMSMVKIAIDKKMSQISNLSKQIGQRWMNENDDRLFNLLEELSKMSFLLSELRSELSSTNAGDVFTKINSDPQFQLGADFAAFGE